MSRAQTIQIFLPFGDPKSVRQAEITSRTVRVFEIPRKELGLFKDEFQESGQPALYFLFGQDESGSDACYIGQSDLIRNRLASHAQNKEFWDRAVVAVSLTNTWTATHIQYMEHKAIERATAAGRFTFDNSQAGHSTPITKWLKADCDEFFETIDVLLATLGYSLFDKPRDEEQTPRNERLYVTRNGIRAGGTWTTEGMTVFAGSTARPADQEKPHTRRMWEAQQRLIHEGVLVGEGTILRFVRDHVFESPSGASCVIVGNSSNGWTEWIDANGRTLKSIHVAEGGIEDGTA